MKINEFSQPQLAKSIKTLQRNISMNCFPNKMKSKKLVEENKLPSKQFKQNNGTLGKSNIKNVNDNSNQNSINKIISFKVRSNSLANFSGLNYNSNSFYNQSKKKLQQINNWKVLEKIKNYQPSKITNKSEESKQRTYILTRCKSFKKNNLRINTNQEYMLRMCKLLIKEDLNRDQFSEFNGNNQIIDERQNSGNYDYQTFRKFENNQEFINQTYNRGDGLSRIPYGSNKPKPQKTPGKICIKSLKKPKPEINVNVNVNLKVNEELNEIAKENEQERKKIIEENKTIQKISSRRNNRPKSFSRFNPISITGLNSKIVHPLLQERKIIIPSVEPLKDENQEKLNIFVESKLKLSPSLKKVIKQKSVERLNRNDNCDSRKNLNLDKYEESKERGTGINTIYNSERAEIIREIPISSINNYQFVKEIGQGAFAKVVLAFHIYSNIRVAIKILDKQLVTDSQMKNRISNEIYVHRKMHHPGIIKLF